MPLCVAAHEAAYLREDEALFDWELGAAAMAALDKWAGAPEGPTRGTCI